MSDQLFKPDLHLITKACEEKTQAKSTAYVNRYMDENVSADPRRSPPSAWLGSIAICSTFLWGASLFLVATSAPPSLPYAVLLGLCVFLGIWGALTAGLLAKSYSHRTT